MQKHKKENRRETKNIYKIYVVNQKNVLESKIRGQKNYD